MLSKCADELPKIGLELEKFAHRNVPAPIYVICESNDPDDGTPSRVTFIALVRDLPRLDECIQLQDGKVCRVRDVCHQVLKYQEPETKMEFFGFEAVVYAEHVEDDEE